MGNCTQCVREANQMQAIITNSGDANNKEDKKIECSVHEIDYKNKQLCNQARSIWIEYSQCEELSKHFHFNQTKYIEEITNFEQISGPSSNGATIIATVASSNGISDHELTIIGIIRIINVIDEIDQNYSNDNAKVAEIGRFYLKKEYRNRGIGNKLLDFAINKAKKLGYNKVRLVTASTMKIAQKMYEKRNFKKIDNATDGEAKWTQKITLNSNSKEYYTIFYEIDI